MLIKKKPKNTSIDLYFVYIYLFCKRLADKLTIKTHIFIIMCTHARNKFIKKILHF